MQRLHDVVIFHAHTHTDWRWSQSGHFLRVLGSHSSPSSPLSFLAAADSKERIADRALDKRRGKKRAEKKYREPEDTSEAFWRLTETPWRKEPFSDARVWTLIQGKKLIVSTAWWEKGGREGWGKEDSSGGVVTLFFSVKHVHIINMMWKKESRDKLRGKCNFLCECVCVCAKTSFLGRFHVNQQPHQFGISQWWRGVG